MVKNKELKNSIYTILRRSINSNLVVITNNFKDATSLDNTHSTKYYSLLLVLYLFFKT